MSTSKRLTAKRAPAKRSPAKRTRAARSQPTGAARRQASVPGTLRLGSLLTIAEVADVYARLQPHLQHGVVDIDARALESIDTAGVQLLLAAGREARERGGVLRVHGGESALHAAAEALGLTAPLRAVVESMI